MRNLIRMVLMSLRRRGLNQKQILLVGYSRAAEQYIDRIIANPQWGYCVRGILDDNVARGTMYKGIKSDRKDRESGRDPAGKLSG